MALATVQDMVTRTRTLLQDTVAPYRYSDDVIVAALNMGVMEARRLRPDILRSSLRSSVPQFELSDDFTIDDMYKPAFVYYMVGYVQMIDEEDVSDQRAAAFLNKFTSQLLSVTS